ncbi:hypothetical protein Tco_0777383 [Tanacetum coccineum]
MRRCFQYGLKCPKRMTFSLDIQILAFLSIPMASNKSFVSYPMVDDCLYAINNEAFMVDKKYINVIDLNLASDEKVSISDRDDLEKTIDDVQVLDNVVCVDRNKDVYGSEAKTSPAIAFVVIKEVGSDNVDVNTDEVVADEDVDLTGNNVFVADKKSVLGDEDVDYCDKNDVVSEQKMFIGHEDCCVAKRDENGDADMNNCTDIPNFAADADTNGIDDVQVLDNVVCVDRTKFLIEFKDVYGSEAKTSVAVDSVVIKEVGSHNVDVNTNEVVADEDIDLAGNNVYVSDKKSFLGDEDVDYCDKNDVVSKQKMFIGHEDVEFAQNNYVDSYTSDETVQSKVTVTEVLAVKDDAFMIDKKYVNASALNLSSDENVIISDKDVLEKEALFVINVDDVPDVKNVVTDGNKPLVMLKSGKIAFNGSHAKSVDDVAGNKDVDGSESKANDVDSVVKDKIFYLVDIKDDDGNVVVSDEKLFNGDEDVEISQQNYVVTGDKMLVFDEDVDSAPKNMLSEAKRSDMGDVDMVPVSDENISVSDDENEMIEVVSVKETIIISNVDEVPVFGSSEKKVVSDYTFSSDDDDRSKNHHRSPIALQFVLDEASEDEEE